MARQTKGKTKQGRHASANSNWVDPRTGRRHIASYEDFVKSLSDDDRDRLIAELKNSREMALLSGKQFEEGDGLVAKIRTMTKEVGEERDATAQAEKMRAVERGMQKIRKLFDESNDCKTRALRSMHIAESIVYNPREWAKIKEEERLSGAVGRGGKPRRLFLLAFLEEMLLSEADDDDIKPKRLALLALLAVMTSLVANHLMSQIDHRLGLIWAT
mmetsp:Transcript_52618/g.111752  ORF Transcript_52618/g.111752 Transcript_52618/m.111752 type:complete len:216 (+) Transcript_52618:106-753(+)|eukprot:CAMPEP_0172533524 /NCGR_PEP_ID=MMETSP1067-20121228/6197_1 /TAXON_ID=265564 ORGANISM="Thalassiosira punctigera, Strain Tpunct2005C2" /NCGR_SAMPLE_ID=MMETSP1067 /ASSEMBLY_ACC=CAM_ASM_000444 /LENGTH=215 /DNA_ID=CAMNT_0013318175 /DNA_START=98 /DNA_END=745 /DNA_ORIENTATION=+